MRPIASAAETPCAYHLPSGAPGFALEQAMSTDGSNDRPDGPTHRSRTDETTERLLEAAAQEFIARGYEAARVSDIARRAGVTSGAVYARWPHKPDILAAALERIFEQMLPDPDLEHLGPHWSESMNRIHDLCARLRTYDKDKDVITQVFGSARNNEAIRKSLLDYLDRDIDRWKTLVERLKVDGFIAPQHSTGAIAFTLEALGIGAHLLVSAGLDERHIPTEEEWLKFVWDTMFVMSRNPEDAR